MSYSELLSEYIKRSAYSLRKVAELCNEKGFSIDHSYISKLRNGKKPPPSEELSRVLAEVLNGDPETLVVEGYKEKAPEEIKNLLNGKCAAVPRSPGVMTNTQQTNNLSRKYSMVIELADILENDTVMLTAGGKPLNGKHRLNLLKLLDKTSTNKNIDKAADLIPILGSIRAGIPLLSEQNKIGEIDVPANLVGRVDFALYVNGNSMIGAGINEGDLVLCKQDYNPYPGEIVVALVNTDETTLKYYIKENDKVLLRAANPKYKDIELGPGDQIQGNVVKILKEPPSINVYKEYLYLKEDHLQEWNEAIEKAAANGIKPSAIREMIDIQVDLAKRLAGLD
jgi:repressor LexA